MDYDLHIPEEAFCFAHVDHVVFPSHLLEVQGDELWLVVVDCLLQRKHAGLPCRTMTRRSAVWYTMNTAQVMTVFLS